MPIVAEKDNLVSHCWCVPNCHCALQEKKGIRDRHIPKQDPSVQGGTLTEKAPVGLNNKSERNPPPEAPSTKNLVSTFGALAPFIPANSYVKLSSKNKLAKRRQVSCHRKIYINEDVHQVNNGQLLAQIGPTLTEKLHARSLLFLFDAQLVQHRWYSVGVPFSVI